MNLLKISIIIVTYNSRTLILDCINSIYKFNDIAASELEIIVIDNSSTEEGRKLEVLLKESYDEKIIFIKNENLGYGHGNNVGIRASLGNIIAIMNPDVRLCESVFYNALQHFDDSDVATVGFAQNNGSTNYSFFQNPEFFIPIISSLSVKNLNKKKQFDPKKYYLSGAFVFFRKSDFEKIGLYDESIFMYFEEPDVSLRFEKLGKKTVFDPSKSYIHLIEVKDEYNVKLLDIGTSAIKIYFDKHQLDLKKYIRLRLTELKIHKFIFTFLGKRNRVEMANAYIKSLTKLL